MKKLTILSSFILLISILSCDNDMFLEDENLSLENSSFDNLTKGKHSKTKLTYLAFPTKNSIEKMKRSKTPSRNYKYVFRIKKTHLKYVKNWSLNTFRKRAKFIRLSGSNLKQPRWNGSVVTLPTITVYGDFLYSDTYAYIPVYDPLDYVNLTYLTNFQIGNSYLDVVATSINYSSLFTTSDAKLPFRLDYDKGKFTIKYKRLNASQIKVSLGITNWKDNVFPIKGSVEFIANRNSSGGFTGANFTIGTGNYKVYSNGNTLDISSSNFTFSFDKSGALKSIGADTTLGSNNKFFYGYGLENQKHTVKVTNTISKEVTSTVTTIYDNGDLGIGYKAQMSNFTGKIEYNTVGEFSMGIQFSYETP